MLSRRDRQTLDRLVARDQTDSTFDTRWGGGSPRSQSTGSSLLVPVSFVQTGGSDGTFETHATWTYTVVLYTEEGTPTIQDYNPDGAAGHDDVNPYSFHRRPDVGSLITATQGIARLDSNAPDGFVLISCNEALNVEVC